MSDYPYKEQGEREELSEQLLRSVARDSTRAGAKSPPHDVVARTAGFASSGQLVTESPPIQPPKWLRAALAESQSHDEVLRFIGRRLEGRVSEHRLHEALAVVNEIARRPDGTELIHKHLTQERVHSLIKKER